MKKTIRKQQQNQVKPLKLGVVRTGVRAGGGGTTPPVRIIMLAK
jgi:hypothetical protein